MGLKETQDRVANKVIRPVVDRLIAAGVLPKPEKEYEVTFVTDDPVTPSDESKKRAVQWWDTYLRRLSDAGRNQTDPE